MSGLVKSVVRITSFVGKELRELIRRPGVLASLILGPFLVMALFGIGYRGYRDPFRTEIIIPQGSDLPQDASYYDKLTQGRLDIVDVGSDAGAAEQRLRARQIDFVVIAPKDAEQQLRAGKQSVIKILWNEVDPVADSLANMAVYTLVHELNSEIIRRAAAAGEQAASQPAISQIPPEVIAEPTRADTANVAPTKPDVLDFFGPAVFALVLQHLAVTLTALSMVRERLGGQMDLFRVSPLNSMELLIGKYVAYAVFSLIVSAAVAALLVGVLGVPLLGGVAAFGAIVLLLTFASLGVGLLISLVADSERQAVQLSMLVLLASVFFSGFVLPVEEFAPPVRYLAYILPVTHGIETLQDSMLRGAVREVWMLAALGGIGVLLYVGSLLRLRRVIRSAD
ncbi:MAG TPA: ABC transporter permease [Candidatus Limnocylindria bacterium]|nr:ABC transporter permease [Candidatus Limnocylindria bacterium]